MGCLGRVPECRRPSAPAIYPPAKDGVVRFPLSRSPRKVVRNGLLVCCTFSDDASRRKIILHHMARKVRVEYPGAIYHIVNRSDRREPIFKDDFDRRRFLETLSEACVKTGWKRTLKEIERTKRSVAARPAAAPVVSVTQAVLDPILSVEERARGGVGAKGPPQPLYRPAPGFCSSAKSPAATTTRFSVLREIACEIASFCCARC